jgi:CRP/FNR family transcriptional regulator, cyclic AMP receptor protein
MNEQSSAPFEIDAFLAQSGVGRRIVTLRANEMFFSQGGLADSVFYIQSGHAKLNVVSIGGKEATISLVAAGEFIGEECIAATASIYPASAIAVTPCTALKIDRLEMIRVLHEEHLFSSLFVTCVLAKNKRMQANLIDQLLNSSEKRLARTLLLMAQFGQECPHDTLIPRITQAALADMIGTTRSRVSFFLNRFKKLGFIEYRGRIRVHRSLLNVLLHDLPAESASGSTVHPNPETRMRELEMHLKSIPCEIQTSTGERQQY